MPSSLTILLPSALGFSPHPPVSVCGTGTYKTIAAFLDSQGPGLPYLCSVRVTSSDRAADLPTALLPRLHRDIHSRIPFPVCVPTVLFICGTGISTCYPSTTSFDLALGPDLPRADQTPNAIKMIHGSQTIRDKLGSRKGKSPAPGRRQPIYFTFRFCIDLCFC